MGNNGDIPGTRDSASLLYYNQKLYLQGISSFHPNYSDNKTLYVYDLMNQTWTQTPTKGNFTLTSFHTAHIYEDSMYVIFGQNSSMFTDEIYSLNLTTLTWSYAGRIDNIFIITYSYIQINSEVYVIFGREDNEVFNWIFKIDLSMNELYAQMLGNSILSPPSRKEHCMFGIINYVVIFGGVGENENYLNDMWAFDVENLYWVKLNITGDIPANRASATCQFSYGNIFLYGGYDKNEVFNDYYFFNIRNLEWSQIIPTSLITPGRYGSC